MEPLLVFSKAALSSKSNFSSEIDVFATPMGNLVHMGATLGEITLFFKDSNLYADDSIAGGKTTKKVNYVQVKLKVRESNEANVIELFQRKLQQSKDTGVVIRFDNETREHAIRGVIKVNSIIRPDDPPTDDDIYLSCGTGGTAADIDPGVVDVGTDSILFYDADDEDTPKIETIVDLVSSIAGSNITATNGVLSVLPPDLSLGTDLDVTNTSSALGSAQGPKTYTAGTSLEDILRDILTDYYVTSISLSGLKIQLETTTEDSFGTEYTATSGNIDIEVGRAVKVNGFTYSVANTSQTENTSVKFYKSGSVYESGFIDSNTSAILTSPIQDEYHTQTSIPYKVSAIDNGGGSSIIISSGNKNIRWLFRAKFGALNTSTITSDSEAQTLYDGLVTTDAFDSLTTKQDINTQGTSYTYTQNYYTWVIFPAAWTIDNITQAGQPVLSDFSYEGDFDIDNGYTDALNKISYSFYVSIYERAFLDGENITISFL